MNKFFLTACAILGLWTNSQTAIAQQSQTYLDGKRGEVILPLGDLSFADAVIGFQVGTGKIKASASDPNVTLGPPAYTGNVDDGTFYSLGCDGTLILQFINNALVDVPGPDLYVFEVGPRVEGMRLEISTDGQDWILIGDIEGGRSEVDIAPVVGSGDTYRFVRLTDDGGDCSSNFAGADVDAVAAIGSALRFVLEGEVLFATESSEIRAEAQAALIALADQIAAARLTSFQVIGHTDANGSEAYNRALSEARALAVRDYLAGLSSLAGTQIGAIGRGESEPVASNADEAGRRMNRRVEIVGTTQ